MTGWMHMRHSCTEDGGNRRISRAAYLCRTSLLGAILAGLLASTTGGTEGPDIADQDITRAVGAALDLDEVVATEPIEVETTDGVVILTGTVDNILARDRAADVAETIKGVRSVVNRIGVAYVVRRDSDLKRDVEVALAQDPATHAYDVHVEADTGVVTLTGEVNSWEEKQLAAHVARGVKGVRDLKDRIIINYGIARTDEEIRSEVEGRLEQDPFVFESLISVEIVGGVVRLSGTVGSVAEKTHAASDAWVTGVTDVDNSGLKVEWWAQNDIKRQSKVAHRSDEEVKKAIEDALRYDPRTAGYGLTVYVENNEVRLTGVADNLATRDAAGQDARNTIGVAGVKNSIKVRPRRFLTATRNSETWRRRFIGIPSWKDMTLP
jgi:osmotically-inducible protein OsmY